MMSGSDQIVVAGNLAAISQRMMELKEQVFAEWEDRVRTSVSNASTLPHPVLLSTFPRLYDEIAEALALGDAGYSAAVPSPSVAMEHGGERARLTRYEAPAVICEYQILRSTIMDVLRAHQVPISDKAIQVLTACRCLEPPFP